MKRDSHTVYGATAGYLVAGVPGALLGALVASLPDVIEKPLRLQHRKSSHSLLAVVLFGGVVLWSANALAVDQRYALALVASYVSHILVDAMTISGVFWLSPFQLRSRLHLLPRGFRVRTSSRLDSLLAGVVGLWLCWMVIPDVVALATAFDVDVFMR